MFPRVAHGSTHPALCICPCRVCSVYACTCSFAGLITPPPTLSDTAITDPHSDTTIFQLRAHWVRISWSIGLEKLFRHVPPEGVEPSTSCVNGDTLSTRPGAPLNDILEVNPPYIHVAPLLSWFVKIS